MKPDKNNNNLTIETINLNQIKPDPQNPRTISTEEINTLTKGINKYGLVDPIIISLKHDNKIIGGHQRYKVLQKTNPNQKLQLIRLGEIGWVLQDTDLKIGGEQDLTALNIALNKISGEWDAQKLEPLLIDLNNSKMDISLTGFNQTELYDINKTLVPQEENNKQKTNKTKEITEITTNIQIGDIYQLGRHKLICGDSTKKETYKKLLGNNKADITFTSPPYNTMQTETNLATMDRFTYYNKSGVYEDFKDNLTDTEYSQLLIKSAKNALQYSDDVYYNIGILKGSKYGVIELLHELRPNFLDILVWEKDTSIPLGLITQKRKVSHICELIFCFNQKGDRSFTHSQWSKGTKNNLIKTGNIKDNPYVTTNRAQFPIELPQQIIKDFTDNTILDNFAGTGTTLIAAEQLGKTSYNIELSPESCQLIINRFEDLTKQKAEKIN